MARKRRWNRRFGKAIRRIVKKHARLHLKVMAKAAPVVTPIVAGAATVFVGPAGGAAVTGLAYGASLYAGGATARGQGYRGAAARKKARQLGNRVAIYGAIGTGAGYATSLALGGSMLTGLAGASSGAAVAGPTTAAVGAGAGSGAGGAGSTVGALGTAVTTIGSATKLGGTGGKVSYYDDISPSMTGESNVGDFYGGQPTTMQGIYNGPTTGAAGPNGASPWSTVLGGLGAMLGGAVRDKGTQGSGDPGSPTDDGSAQGGVGTLGGDLGGGGGGEGLLSNPLVLAALAVGAIMLLRKKG